MAVLVFAVAVPGGMAVELKDAAPLVGRAKPACRKGGVVRRRLRLLLLPVRLVLQAVVRGGRVAGVHVALRLAVLKRLLQH